MIFFMIISYIDIDYINQRYLHVSILISIFIFRSYWVLSSL